MKITRADRVPTTRGPADWFTGDVLMDVLAAPEEGARAAAAHVRFAPGARTAWHTHPHGQTIHITEGMGRCQRRGGPVEVLHPGDRVFFAPGEDHWHGAAPDRYMVHLAVHEVDDAGQAAVWGAHVTDDEYGTAVDAGG